MAEEIQLRRGTLLEWETINPILAQGEPGLETDTNQIKYGTGLLHWMDLPYYSPSLNPSNADNITSGTLADARLSANVPLLDISNTFVDTNIFPQIIVGEGAIGITSGYPETILIRPENDLSHTPVRIKSSIDEYFELLCHNTSNTENASSDIVAQADNGTLTSNYIDFGINSSNYTANDVGRANDGYLYTDGGNLHLGASSGGKSIIFFTNGTDSLANKKLEIDYIGNAIFEGNVTCPDGINTDHAVTVGQLDTKQDSLGDISGIVKGNGAGSYSSASAGTDYLTPTGNGSQLTGITKARVGLSEVGNIPQMPLSYLDIDDTLVNNSDVRVPSQQAIKSYVDTGLSGKLSNIVGLNISDLTNDEGYISTVALSDCTDVTLLLPENGEVLKYNGSNWYNGQLALPTSAGSGVNFYPVDVASDISGYNILPKFPGNHAEDDETAVCNNNKVLIDQYVSDEVGLGGGTIDAGVWEFLTWGYTSVVDHTRLSIDIYKRTEELGSAPGTETFLFGVETDSLTTILDIYSTASVQQAYTINATDRLVLKIYGETDSTSDVTIHFVNGGTTHYSYFKTPLIVRHNDLAGLQGGSTNERYHLTSSQVTNLGNQSNTNTGDETKSTIETKLGAASASNAGYLTTTDWSAFDGKLGSVTGTSLDNVFSSNGLLKRTNTGTYSVDTNTYLTSLSGIDADNINSGVLADARLTSNVTVQGNTFNGVSQLVRTNVSGQLTALDAHLLTGLTKTQVGLSNVPNTDCTNATNITTGTIANNLLTSGVTLQGNTFNGVSQLVQTNISGQLTALDGHLLTGLTASQIGSTNTAFNQNFETNTSNIKMNSAVSVGALSTIARADHVHASDTTKLNSALASTHIYVGSGSGVATDVAMSNDATLSNTGALTLATVNSSIGTYNNVTINAKGLATSGSNVSYLIANQSITLSSDVTGSGTTSIAVTIASGAVTLTKMANLGANTYIGNNTGVSAVPLAVATNTAFNKNFETNTANIKMNGAVAVGASGNVADASHIHASDTSREAVANKDTTITLGTSDTLYPSQNAVKTYVDNNLLTTRTSLRSSIRAANNATQAITGGSNTQVAFQVESYDVNSEFSANTFTSKSIQTVLVSGYLEYTANTINTTHTTYAKIYKDGAEIFRVANITSTVSTNHVPGVYISFPVKCIVGTTIALYTLHNDGTFNRNLVSGGAFLTIENIF